MDGSRWGYGNNSFCATCSTAKVLPPLVLERMKRSPRACACAALVIIIIAIAVHYNICLYTTLKIINTQTNTYRLHALLRNTTNFIYCYLNIFNLVLFCRWSKLDRLFWKLLGCYTCINTGSARVQINCVATKRGDVPSEKRNEGRDDDDDTVVFSHTHLHL